MRYIYITISYYIIYYLIYYIICYIILYYFIFYYIMYYVMLFYIVSYILYYIYILYYYIFYFFLVSPKNATRTKKHDADHSLRSKTQHQSSKQNNTKDQSTKKWRQICHRIVIKNRNRPKIKRLSMDLYRYIYIYYIINNISYLRSGLPDHRKQAHNSPPVN